jgi:hypothetical protein
MQEYLKDIFPRIIRYSKNLDDLTVLTNKPWVLMSKNTSTREVWIFRKNNVLIVSRNGVVEEGSWEYIPEAESIYIKISEVKRLINKAFVDDITLLLRLDGGKEVLALANENKIPEEFEIDKYLDEQYQSPSSEYEPQEVIVEAPSKISLIKEKISAEKSGFQTTMIALSIVLLTLIILDIALYIEYSNSGVESFQAGLIIVFSVTAILIIGCLSLYIIYRSTIEELFTEKQREEKKILDDGLNH